MSERLCELHISNFTFISWLIADIGDVSNKEVAIRDPRRSFFRGQSAPHSLREAIALVVQAVERGDVHDLDLDLLHTDLDIAYAKAEDNLHQAEVAGVAETRTVDEIAAIAFYTCEDYYRCLNKALRNANREAVRPHVEFLRLFMHALKKCSKYTGRLVYRGKKGD